MLQIQTKKILIAEDEPVLLQSLIFTLKRFQFKVTGLQNGIDVVNLLAQPDIKYELLIIDIQLPGITGLEVIDKIRDIGNVIPVIVITAYKDHSVVSELQRRNIWEYLAKPFSMEALMKRVEHHLGPHI